MNYYFWNIFIKYKTKKHKKNKKDIKIEEVILNENPNFHIKGFDLSSNNILYSGIYSLCKALKINKSIEYLNMFHNCIDVNGTGQIEQVLKEK